MRRKPRLSSQLSGYKQKPTTSLLSKSSTVSLNTSLLEAEEELSTVFTDGNLMKKASFMLQQINIYNNA